MRDDMDRGVFVIVYKGSLWGMHVESCAEDGARRTRVVAFERRADAEVMAHRLWVHRLLTHSWPDTVVAGAGAQLEIQAGEVLMMSPSPLQIDVCELGFLIDRLGRSGAAVSLTDAFDDSAEEISLQGRYYQASAPKHVQQDWLREMHRRAPRPRD